MLISFQRMFYPHNRHFSWFSNYNFYFFAIYAYLIFAIYTWKSYFSSVEEEQMFYLVLYLFSISYFSSISAMPKIFLYVLLLSVSLYFKVFLRIVIRNEKKLTFLKWNLLNFQEIISLMLCLFKKNTTD